MKNIPLTVFFVLVAITGTIAGFMLWNVPQRFTPKNELIGENLVDVFSTTLVEEIAIASSESEALLKKKGDSWVVANRQDYPIDKVDEVNNLVESILLLRVGLEIPAAERHYAEMGLLAPDQKAEAEAYQEKRKKEGEENPEDPRGLRITMKGAGGKVFADLILGDDFGNTPGERYRGIVLRSLAGHQGAWKVLGTLGRRTGDNATGDVRRGSIAEAKAWLAYKFIEVEKIKSISLSAPNDKEFKGWTVTRATEQDDFSTGDLKEDEEMDTSGTSSFKTLFSKMRFEDVVDPAEAEKNTDSAQARQAVINTFDGFTYTFNFSPMKPKEKEEGDDSPPPGPSNYIGTVKVEGNFPETREKGEKETEENAKVLDDTHAAKLENLKFKLAQEQVYQGYTYEFAQYVISSLNKTRAEVVKAKAPPSPEDDGKEPAASPAGSKPRASAVSPPVRVPPLPPRENP